MSSLGLDKSKEEEEEEDNNCQPIDLRRATPQVKTMISTIKLVVDIGEFETHCFSNKSDFKRTPIQMHRLNFLVKSEMHGRP